VIVSFSALFGILSALTLRCALHEAMTVKECVDDTEELAALVER
jgi:hypothetical protein